MLNFLRGGPKDGKNVVFTFFFCCSQGTPPTFDIWWLQLQQQMICITHLTERGSRSWAIRVMVQSGSFRSLLFRFKKFPSRKTLLDNFAENFGRFVSGSCSKRCIAAPVVFRCCHCFTVSRPRMYASNCWFRHLYDSPELAPIRMIYELFVIT